LAALAFTPLPALAQASVTALSVSTSPSLSATASLEGAEVLGVGGGSVVWLSVVATYSNQTTANVTSAAGTTITSLAPDILSAGSNGRLDFSTIAGSAQAAAVLVEHGGITRLVGFRVTP
jgi:hypothetical protein